MAMPARRAEVGVKYGTSAPFSFIVPDVGLMSPAMIFDSVDFPAPFSPTSPRIFPDGIATLTNSSARVFP